MAVTKLRTSRSYQQMLKNNLDNDFVQYSGSGAPTDGTSGTMAGFAGTGSVYVDVATGNWYCNLGTKASPTWRPDIAVAKGTISAADIVSTAAGKFGHAQGQILLAGGGTHIVYEPISIILKYKFATAAYTAGGNTTLAWSAGGANITGLIAAASFAGAGSSKAVALYPLAAAGMALVENGGFNLVSSAAFTQPGTAAGTIDWTLQYRIHATGF
jgi:hypothetical protein